MDARTYGRDTYLRLKFRTKNLVALCGGLEAAARGTRVGKSLLANCADHREHGSPDQWAPIDVVADLEMAAGMPIVTRELARLAGYDLIPMAGRDGGALEPLADHCRHAVLMGRATDAAIEMDADGVREPGELTEYVAHLLEARDHLQRVLDKARAELAAAGGPALRVA